MRDTLFEAEHRTRMSDNETGVIIIGMGNLYRSDDGVGIIVARRLREQISSRVSIVEEDCDAISLLNLWKGTSSVILIDSVQSGAAPGTLHRFDLCSQRLPIKSLKSSSHCFNLAEAVELACILRQLPERLILYGIESESTATGTQLSPSVEKSIALATTRVLDELNALIRWPNSP